MQPRMQEKSTTTSTREANVKGRNETRLALWEEHFKDPIVALDSPKVRGSSVLWLIVDSTAFVESRLQ